jgi:subfamily B ATP-binding cassette protein MsbA
MIDSYKKSVYLEATSTPLLEIIIGLTLAIALWYGGTAVMSGQMTAGEFFSCITALMMSHRPLKSISQIHNNLQEGLAAAQRIFLLLDQKPLIIEAKTAQDIHFSHYDIVFDNISFAYRKGKKKVLDNFNMKIASGTTVALVGSSGVGKSTILQLLQRFYDPDQGKIMISDHSIHKMKLDQLRNSIAFVSQDLALFDETIAYNIAYGQIGATEAEIIKAAKAASAHDFIRELPDGYNTPIGQAGLKLSGGQKQRIAIARALLKNAPILLLDEATSALDSVSEVKVQEALNLLKQGKTTIVIAHRLSTIETADAICVIDGGKILDTGTHKELLETSERYKKLYSYYKYAQKDNEKFTD